MTMLDVKDKGTDDGAYVIVHDGDYTRYITLDDLYDAFKRQLIEELRVITPELLEPTELVDTEQQW